ncbi:hemicentin-1 isoform X1 [Synchiropus splendidus]|uniref:hemicentin-1 isoform X1 n=1 Tax=Synchiropus splendidus TaxID=270530 RepID=UPI00237D8117|nr:hemicentin-1 isoform X1 [Synchiropus splendidus]
MRPLWLLFLGFLFRVATSLDTHGGEQIVVVTRNITAVLGQDVHLGCRFLGEGELSSSMWKRQIPAKNRSKRLAGFFNGKVFSRQTGVLIRGSPTNLTVEMKVTSVDQEGEYTCEFATSDEEFSATALVTVVARPTVFMGAKTINGTHNQSVWCSAVGGRPPPQISWLINNSQSVDTNQTEHANGTVTLTSTVHLLTHLLEDDRVTCLVKHPTLPGSEQVTVKVETYVKPNVTAKAEMVERGGSDFWVVSCTASGGRPDTDISLAPSAGIELHSEMDSDPQTRSFLLPAAAFEGLNATCVFDHPKFTHKESRVITLPSLYLGEVCIVSPTVNNQTNKSVELQEGQSVAAIRFLVTGNVPRYNFSCTKDDDPLPPDVELSGSDLSVRGPVALRHAGVYRCVASYHRHKSALRFKVTVKPKVVAPVVRVEVLSRDGRSQMECWAEESVPAASVSWLLPPGVSGDSWFNFTSHNGSHSVRGVLVLPACSALDLTAECVINHPALEQPENRSVTLPLCGPPDITVRSGAQWKHGEQYTEAVCSVDSVAPPATISWLVGGESISHVMQTEPRADGSVRTQSWVHFLSSLYSGQTVACVVEHPTLKAPESRALHIPVGTAPQLRVSLLHDQDSQQWVALCNCTGEAAGANLTWILPDNTKAQTSLLSQHEGRVLNAQLMYQFSLAMHEGHDLTCVCQFDSRLTEKKTVHIPRYYLSTLRVLNQTSMLKSRNGHVLPRLSLQGSGPHQRVVLRAEGNVPEYDLRCQRSDGVFVDTEESAMVFKRRLTEEDSGLYTCRASFYHHSASVQLLVEVTDESGPSAPRILVCMSTVLAIALVLSVLIWALRRREKASPQKKKESVSTLTPLMQDVSSSAKEGNSGENLQLVNIVIDVKSTV